MKIIDSVITSLGAMEYIAGSKMIDFNESIKVDHREFVFDLNIE